MKQFYILIFIAIFNFTNAMAQACPESGSTLAGGTKLVFGYSPGTSFCSSRPTTIFVGTTEFVMVECTETLTSYDRVTGPALTGQDFTVTSGFATPCTFTNGTLPIETFDLSNDKLKVYPNPLASNQNIKLSFGKALSGNLSLYSITGKVVFKDVINN
ncbi:hypothetical protein AW14_14185 [Siansivirga zeaxanthinifaciens CC-SAMT-1]|uniref:Uncharacterized protein n=1 Tax=Siansivirga zeaxanthinifaciens CC-SAMT-1 TaxID=1454006 RepID=A0A0C5WPX7_9FLAO|nr:hypothetical protein AW14_14185 [Siansivirga zeaxanthinifaciens CC-SAMT-1]